MGTVPVLVRVLFTNVDSTVLMYAYAMSTVLQSRYCTGTSTRTRTVKRARANHTSAYGTYTRTMFLYSISRSGTDCIVREDPRDVSRGLRGL